MQTRDETDEYTTYAPAGSRCAECDRQLKPLIPVRRAQVERQSGPTLLLYRHFECVKGNGE